MTKEQKFKKFIKGTELRVYSDSSNHVSHIFYVVKDGKCLFQIWFPSDDEFKKFLIMTRYNQNKDINFKNIEIHFNCSTDFVFNKFHKKKTDSLSVLYGDDTKGETIEFLRDSFKENFMANDIISNIEDIEFENGWEYLN